MSDLVQKIVKLCFSLFRRVCSIFVKLLHLWRKPIPVKIFLLKLVVVIILVKFLLFQLYPHNFHAAFHDFDGTNGTIISSLLDSPIRCLYHITNTCFGQKTHLFSTEITSLSKSLIKWLVRVFGLTVTVCIAYFPLGVTLLVEGRSLSGEGW